MHYMVVYGYAENQIWYESDEVHELGETVNFKVFNREQQGIIIKVGDPNSSKWQPIVVPNKKVVEHASVKYHMEALIDCFIEGIISREEFVEITEGFLRKNEISLMPDSGLEQIIKVLLPDVRANYIVAPGDEDEKEFGFRKAIKEWEYMLGYECKREEVAEARQSPSICRHDPVEETEAYQRVELDVHRLVRAKIGPGGYLGYCHLYWGTKKAILREKYGIIWRSPADLNSRVHFD